jgi:alternate F1F0 ATPase F1 subunit gamma
MSDTSASLRRKIDSAGDLQSVVRTMKAMAASSIGQYEQSVRALGDYYRTVELGLSVCFRDLRAAQSITAETGKTHAAAIGAVVFGSDQGLVGQFNDVAADYALKTLAALPGEPPCLGGWRARACAPGGRGPCADGMLQRTEFRQGRHLAGRADTRGERDAPQPG